MLKDKLEKQLYQRWANTEQYLILVYGLRYSSRFQKMAQNNTWLKIAFIEASVLYHEKLFQTGRDEKIVEREAEKWLLGNFDKQLEKLFDKYAAPEYYCYVQGVCGVSNPLFKLATKVVTMGFNCCSALACVPGAWVS